MHFDSCSAPETAITTYFWEMLGTPVGPPPPEKSFTFSFAADPRCGVERVFNRPVRLTVSDRFGQSASVQENVEVRSGFTLTHDSVQISFTSRLIALPPDGSARGRLTVNGLPLPPEDSASPMQHTVRVSPAELRVEGVVTAPVRGGGFWELDFSTSEAVLPGSFEVEIGTAASRGDRKIVLRLNGEQGERFRIRVGIR